MFFYIITLGIIFLPMFAFAATDASSLRDEVNTINQQAVLAPNVNGITIDNDITLDGEGLLQMIYASNLALSFGEPLPFSKLTITGGGNVLSGNNERERGFFIRGGNVTINNLTFFECHNIGGTGGDHDEGGGGGLGAGGALFIMGGTTFQGNNLIFERCIASGGDGGGPLGLTQAGDGGGGGIAGNGGSGGSITGDTSAGAGGGFGGKGGNGAIDVTGDELTGGGGAGLLGPGEDGEESPGGASGGTAGPGSGTGGAGGYFGGGSGDGQDATVFGAGGGGAGQADDDEDYGGGDGHFGGGGGGSNGNATISSVNLTGGNAGFGGGGGGGSQGGGFGGFGGGGGSNTQAIGTNCGFGGGSGGSNDPDDVGTGGGGAGLGGAIFIHGGDGNNLTGAAVTLVDPIFRNNSTTPGAGGVISDGTSRGESGRSFGRDIYLMSGGSLTFDISDGFTTIVPHAIDGNQGRGVNSNGNYMQNQTTNPINPGISDTDGGLIKTGPGTLVLFGENTYSGLTTIDEGILRLEPGTEDFAWIMTPVQMSTGGDVSVLHVPKRATIRFLQDPQNIDLGKFPYQDTIPVGTLTQMENSVVKVGEIGNALPLANNTLLEIESVYQQDANSTLEIVLCSNRGEFVPFVFVSSDGSTMEGGLRVEALGDNYIVNSEYTVVQALGPGIVASSLDMDVITVGNLAPELKFEVVPRSDGDELLKIRVLEQVIFVTVPTDDFNCREYVNYIRSLDPVLGSQLAIFLQNLGSALTPEEICDAIFNIIPSVYSGLEWINLDSQVNLLNSISFLPECLYSPECYAWGGQFWSRSTGWFEDYNQLQSMPGFKTANASFTLGYDHAALEDWRFGALGNYTHNNVDWDQSFGKADVDSLQFGVYTEYCGWHFYGDGAIIAGINWYDVRRFVHIMNAQGAFEETVTLANFNGYPLVLHGKVGWDGRIGENVTVSPELSVSYHYLHLEDFTERGLSPVIWNKHSRDSHMLHTDLGALLSRAVDTQSYRFVFFGGVSWIVNCPLNNGYYTVSLAGFSQEVDFFSYNKCQHRVAPKTGLKVTSLNNCTSVEIKYQGEFNGKQSYHSITGAIQAHF